VLARAGAAAAVTPTAIIPAASRPPSLRDKRMTSLSAREGRNCPIPSITCRAALKGCWSHAGSTGTGNELDTRAPDPPVEHL